MGVIATKATSIGSFVTGGPVWADDVAAFATGVIGTGDAGVEGVETAEGAGAVVVDPSGEAETLETSVDGVGSCGACGRPWAWD